MKKVNPFKCKNVTTVAIVAIAANVANVGHKER
jgi:hypothetical protein